MLKCVFWSFP
jgi:hypothetical protein